MNVHKNARLWMRLIRSMWPLLHGWLGLVRRCSRQTRLKWCTPSSVVGRDRLRARLAELLAIRSAASVENLTTCEGTTRQIRVTFHS
jgi:hypothetical protein